MPNSQELQNLARLRLLEAEALFAAGLYDGCVYLCGYVLESALKAVICKTLDVMEYPVVEKGTKDLFKTHEFESLVLLAGLRGKLEPHRQSNSAFDVNWSVAARWKPDLRYTISQSQSGAMAVLEALRSTDGVLPWLSRQW